MYFRSGHLVVSKPFSYIATKQPNGGLLVELPFSFYNTGATPIIVDNIYLVIMFKDTRIPLFFNAVRDRLGVTEQKPATQFVVNGRKTVTNIFSFHVHNEPINIDVGNWDCELFGKLNSKKYKSLLKFSLNVKYLDNSAKPRLNFDDEYQKLIE
jgi:hypothetical protein